MSAGVPAVRLDRKPVREEEVAREEPENEARDGSEEIQVSLEPGMTLYSLALGYKVTLSSLMQANGISDPTSIPAGTMITIPDASGAEPRPRSRKAARAPAAPAPPRDEIDSSPATLGIAWPLIGQITAGFGLRGRHSHHAGVDIDGVTGEEVRAVAAGIVVASGSEGKYGRTVVIDHGSGLTTLYAHASRLLVHEGDRVGQGDAIAEVGASGNAHGSHLHFEVRRNGHPVDPTPYLRSGNVPLPGGQLPAGAGMTSSGSH
jgi:murein DD-endopeptidase MepM/ murein hydrolase activator NlpD